MYVHWRCPGDSTRRGDGQRSRLLSSLRQEQGQEQERERFLTGQPTLLIGQDTPRHIYSNKSEKGLITPYLRL
jgi:hypothetical protein